MTDKRETFVARWDHAMCSTCGAAHAPTPTPAPGLDLDAVDQDFRAAMEGPPGNRSAIKFYHETWPALIAEVRALRARLDATLVAPVDPEAFAQRMCSHQHAADPSGLVGWDDLCDKYQEIVASSVRATLIARGIPVTPEVGK